MKSLPFTTRTIEEVIDTLIDYRGKTPEKTTDGIKLITAKVIKGGTITDGTHEFIAEGNYDAWMRRGLPKQWDILMTTEAPLGEVAQLRTSERVALAQRVILLRGNPKVIDQGYFFQSMKSPFVQSELAARATGTTVLGIKQSELRKIRIPLFPLPTQRIIAAILSAYDDLIENNTRRIQILEQQAQAVYREWFVNFRFPGHEKVRLVASTLGKVPQGWSVRRLDEVAVVNASSVRRGEEPGQIQYVDISSVTTGRIERFEPMAYVDAPGRARRLVKHGDTVWSCVRPNRKSFALIVHPPDDLVVSTGFAVLTPLNVPFSFLHQAATTDDFVGYLTNHATGSAYPAVTGNDFEAATLLVPDGVLLQRFHEQCEPMLLLKDSLLRKNANLRSARDLLLPKLISGVLDVSQLDVEQP